MASYSNVLKNGTLPNQNWKVVSPNRKDSDSYGFIGTQPLAPPESSPIKSEIDWKPKLGSWSGNNIWSDSNLSPLDIDNSHTAAAVLNSPKQYRSFSTASRDINENDVNHLFQGYSIYQNSDYPDSPHEGEGSRKEPRSRSKSSSAAYAIHKNLEHQPLFYQEPSSPASAAHQSIMSPQERGLWPNHANDPSSTTPNNLFWDDKHGSSPVRNSPNHSFSPQRRFSHAPINHFPDYPPSESVNPLTFDTRRRHSLAGPYVQAPPLYLTQDMQGLRITEETDPAIYQDINDYFENTEHRTKAWVEAGKNLQLQSQQPTTTKPLPIWPLYVVEFKAGRRDFFYVEENDVIVKNGDLVMVEADRGKDLGKVICDSIMSDDELESYKISHPDVLIADAQFHIKKETLPKKIFGKSSGTEIGLLVTKSQDESKAMAVCQTKIRQKKLPMEIVDAEYQWDRRKLTFYFVADRRIDFRDLVRELFKLYKTRIWMCAVNPLSGQ